MAKPVIPKAVGTEEQQNAANRVYREQMEQRQNTRRTRQIIAGGVGVAALALTGNIYAWANVFGRPTTQEKRSDDGKTVVRTLDQGAIFQYKGEAQVGTDEPTFTMENDGFSDKFLIGGGTALVDGAIVVGGVVVARKRRELGEQAAAELAEAQVAAAAAGAPADVA